MARRRLTLLSLVLVACASTGTPEAPAPALHLDSAADDPGSGSLVVTGLPRAEIARLAEAGLGVEEWERLLSVRTILAWPDGPAVLGRYSTDGSSARFTPRFPLASGLEYRGRFDGKIFDALIGRPGRGTASPVLSFAIPEPKLKPSTRVLAIYPSVAEIPENALRLYIEFSAPMRAKEVGAHIRLLDSAGEEVGLPFVEVKHGLWDPQQLRLTLFFHPGRVKRGVGPNLALGPPLRAGETYRLVVARSLEDSRGLPLAADFEKKFRASAADRSSPDPSRWRLEAPVSSGGALSIDFPEPLDRALLMRFLRLTGPGGEAIEGKIEISQDETRWSFSPTAPWQPGEHTLSVHPGLEDLAGNSIERTFEERPALSDADEPQFGESGTPSAIELSFRPLIEPASRN